MKRLLEDLCDFFSSLPADLYPLLVPDFTVDVKAFRFVTLTLRCVSHTSRVNVDIMLSSVRELGPLVSNTLRDAQLGLLGGIRVLRLGDNPYITESGLRRVTSLVRLSMPHSDKIGDSCIATLPGLTRLSLKKTHGWKAESLCALTGLVSLNLKKSGVKEYVCFTALSRLAILKVDHDESKGLLCLLTTLKSLDFRSMSLHTGRSLATMRSLTCLKLSCVNFIKRSGDMQWFCQFPSLTHLSMDYCYSFAADKYLVLPNTLTRLSLVAWSSDDEKNTIHDKMLQGLTNLRRLNLRQSGAFTNAIFRYLPLLERLNVSHAHHHSITDDGILQIASSLKCLHFNDASIFSNGSLCQMTSLTRLVMLNESPLRGGDRTWALSHLTNLRALSCSMNYNEVMQLTSLTSLHLWASSCCAVGYLSLLTNLESLSVSARKIPALESLTKLTRLVLLQAKLSKTDVQKNTALTYLRCLIADHTHPTQFDHLVRLQRLCVSGKLLNKAPVIYMIACLREKGVVVQSLG